MLWKQVPGFSHPWHPPGRPWEMSVLYRWGNATRQVKPRRSHTGSVWQGWDSNHSSSCIQPLTSPFSPFFLMQNTWRQELQSSRTHTIIQMSLHWCINKNFLCKYMGKPLNLPFHSYITVADTFLSGGRMSIHTRTYEAKHPSLLQSIPACCWTSDSSNRPGTNGNLPVIPPGWQILLLENGKKVEVLSPKTPIYLLDHFSWQSRITAPHFFRSN